MIGKYNGFRFVIGTVKVVAGDTWGGKTMFDLYATIPAADKYGGQSLWLESIQGESKANLLAAALNAA